MNFIEYRPDTPGNEHLIGYFADAIRTSKHSEYLHQYNAFELSQLRLFRAFHVGGAGSALQIDAGFALKRDGDIVSAHNNTGRKGFVPYLIDKAISEGGYKLDHFDGKLSEIFGRWFPEVYHTDLWDPSYAPVAWKYQPVGVPPLFSIKADTTPEWIQEHIQQLKADYAAGKPSVIYRRLEERPAHYHLAGFLPEPETNSLDIS